MNLLPDSQQQQILDTLSGLLREKAPIDRFREHGEVGNEDDRLWPILGDLGFLGLGISDSFGGVGLSAAEEVLVYREFGNQLLSVGVFGLTLGARIAALGGDDTMCRQILSGSLIIGVASSLHTPVQMSETACAGAFHLFEASKADLILLMNEQGAALITADQFVERKSVKPMDAILTLERSQLPASRPALWIDASDDALHTRAILLASAYATGIAATTQSMAVEYAKIREQFGKPIGSFQAVKHLCAEMAIRSEAAQSQCLFSALVVAEDRDDKDFQAISSKITSVDAALQNAASNIQIHGAFGFTAEANAHHFLKRAHVMDQLWGDLRHQRARLLSLPTPAT
ncbi:MAG: acyl-CoA dehydrogenase family protein [Luminiphilus sp.]|jgi:alkylation response protein AidB-like acyl-CoA dehydrogenase|nr:acyl-CoA dehydrogenase family protein [Luminiphilus sp.]|tara:strand:+ start:7688 stop:8719 length:1032 start_codon:yes stop_codon:yes gene_type:complete